MYQFGNWMDIQGVPKKVPSLEITFVVNLGLLHLWKFKLASDEQQQKRVPVIKTSVVHEPFSYILKKA
jgi:hypothetical protein